MRYATGIQSRPFLSQDGAITDLTTWGGGEGSATAINASGQIVGQAEIVVGESNAVLWYDGTMTDLGRLPGDDYSLASSINDNGQIVGLSLDRETGATAVLWQDLRLVDLNDLLPEDSGWYLRAALDINAGGSIVGWGDFQGATRPFLMAPIVDNVPLPEPAGVGGLVCGAWVMARRRR